MAYQKAQRDYTLAISQKDLAENVQVIGPLSKRQEEFLNCKSNFVLYAGGQNSAKSHYCMVNMLSSAVDDEEFTGLVLRSSLTKIKQAGGLFHMSKRLFPKFGAKSNNIEYTFRFPIGSSVKYGYLQEGKAEELHQGLNASQIVIDEIADPEITEDDVMYLLGRLRGASKQRRQLKATGNPNRDSFIRHWLEKGGYIDKETGMPIASMEGVETLFVQVNGEVQFFKNRTEIKRKYGTEIADNAMTFTFLPATIMENPYALKNDPFALTSLRNLKDSEKERLLYGCWRDSESTGFMTKDMFNIVKRSDIPLGEDVIEARAWDFAASKVGDNGEKFPDATVGIKGYYQKSTGHLYITDIIRIFESFAVVEQTLLSTAKRDGSSCYQIIPSDPGAASKQVTMQRKAKLMQNGSKVLISKTSKSKLARAEPFILAVQQGSVSVVNGVFEDAHWQEIEAFDGTRSTRHRKDDIPDSLADLFNAVNNGLMIPSINVGDKKNMQRLGRLGNRRLF